MLRLLGAKQISAASSYSSSAIETERFLQSRERHAQQVAAIASMMMMIHQQVVMLLLLMMAEMMMRRICEALIDQNVWHVEGAATRHEWIRRSAALMVVLVMAMVMVMSVQICEHVQVIHVHEQAGRIHSHHSGGVSREIAGGR